MVNITEKSNTLRIAIAEATVNVSSQDTIDAILNRTVPKGDVFEMSKAAGLLGIKKHLIFCQIVTQFPSNLRQLPIK